MEDQVVRACDFEKEDKTDLSCLEEDVTDPKNLVTDKLGKKGLLQEELKIWGVKYRICWKNSELMLTTLFSQRGKDEPGTTGFLLKPGTRKLNIFGKPNKIKGRSLTKNILSSF